ncbi:hypothetical protein IWX49DRAFT_61105 [Phyllosticta citricarpa]|uniref:Vegetative cell wall protein gp1 n=1 Tax=Phyllosticta citricarpa TaxID=55181 RepID=A0ABR1LLI4_9PEZI
MYSTHYHASSPAYAMPQDAYYRTPPVSPSPGTYYSPRYKVQTATPSPRASPKYHTRQTSHQEPPVYTFRATPQYYATSSPRYTARDSTPQRVYYQVSGSSARRRDSDAMPCAKSCACKNCQCGEKNRSARTHAYHKAGGNGDVFDDYNASGTPPPPYEPYQGHKETYTYSYPQTQEHKEPHTPKTRSRRASTAARPAATPTPERTASTKKKSPPPKAVATEADARRAGIPAGFSFKNWDPNEEPILLLGSVFDANSLGKWIYDWTVFSHGATTPMSEIAGELWLLLIQLAGKIRRAEECAPKIRKQENKDMVEDFLDSGERLWLRFNKLLKICEEYMWKAARREAGGKKPASMGKNSGCEFVHSIFGRDRELERTEKIMTGIRLWNMRFDANCDDILQYPSA